MLAFNYLYVDIKYHSDLFTQAASERFALSRGDYPKTVPERNALLKEMLDEFIARKKPSSVAIHMYHSEAGLLGKVAWSRN